MKTGNKEKLIRVWSSKRERSLWIRVEYQERQLEEGCKVLQLQQILEND